MVCVCGVCVSAKVCVVCVALRVLSAVLCSSVALCPRFLDALWSTSAARVGSPLDTYRDAQQIIR